jgi:high-affinity nickel-transport protein
MVDIWPFVIISIPTMIVLGMRHALDVDHITAIDNLVRLHNAIKKIQMGWNRIQLRSYGIRTS